MHRASATRFVGDGLLDRERVKVRSHRGCRARRDAPLAERAVIGAPDDAGPPAVVTLWWVSVTFAWEDSKMNPVWAFERDRLIARDSASSRLHWWPVEREMGPILAHILNAVPDLGRALLPPWWR